MPDYAVYATASESIQGYSGTAVLIRKRIEHLLLSSPQGYSQSSPKIHIEFLGMENLDARIVTLELPSLWIVCCYAPATGDEVR